MSISSSLCSFSASWVASSSWLSSSRIWISQSRIWFRQFKKIMYENVLRPRSSNQRYDKTIQEADKDPTIKALEQTIKNWIKHSTICLFQAVLRIRIRPDPYSIDPSGSGSESVFGIQIRIRIRNTDPEQHCILPYCQLVVRQN